MVGYLLVITLYRWFPPITVWTGLSLLGVAIAEALWARYVRAKITDGEIGAGPGWLHPLAVARSVMVAKASAWVGALVLGWWIGVLVYLLQLRSRLPVAAADWVLRITPAAAIAIEQSIPAYPQVAAAYTPTSGYYPLAPWAGFAVLCAWAALALALAVFLLRRRDA